MARLRLTDLRLARRKWRTVLSASSLPDSIRQSIFMLTDGCAGQTLAIAVAIARPRMTSVRQRVQGWPPRKAPAQAVIGRVTTES
jgi:hypothetical protein